jgi:hypothetical protein
LCRWDQRRRYYGAGLHHLKTSHMQAGAREPLDRHAGHLQVKCYLAIGISLHIAQLSGLGEGFIGICSATK